MAEIIQRSGTRLGILLLGGAGLLAGLAAALALLNLPVVPGAERLPSLHGPLMVFGFVTTLIALERAVSLRRLWAFASPVLTGAGGLLLLTPLPIQAGLGVQCAGLALLVAVYSRLWARLPSVPISVEWLGSVLALGGGLLWLGGAGTPAVLPWVLGYLVLTIAGERLELSHVGAPPPVAERVLLALALLLAVAASLSLVLPSPGNELVALALIGIALWLFRFDVARKLVRAKGLPRFSAASMLAGAVWLLIAGVLWLVTGPLAGAATYDAVVHAVTLGFTMSMIFGHAPVIFPAVLRRPLLYHPVLWIPAVLLHGSLLVRVLADLRGWPAAWQTAGVLGVAAILAFVVSAVARIATANTRPARTRRERT